MKQNKPGPYQTLKDEGTYKIGYDKPTIDFKQIGKRGVRRYDGVEKAGGKALYTRDVNLPGMLYAKVLASPYAQGQNPSSGHPQGGRISGCQGRAAL